MTKLAIVMPTYEPSEVAIDTVSSLRAATDVPIVVVDDGSGHRYQYIFERIGRMSNVVVLTHIANQGKGRALKTAMMHVANEMPEMDGIVTIDSDGQHAVADILNVMDKLTEKSDALILGVRNFSQKGIPVKSKIGNEATRILFRFMTGKKLSDTQTGLRGIPRRWFETFVAVEGERFEYEMNALAHSGDFEIELIEVPIQTIYIEGNQSTHFKPVQDSIRVYKVFVTYLFSSGASFVLDVALFTLFTRLFSIMWPVYYIIIATIVARLLSSLFNYFVNRHAVFKEGSKQSFYRYFVLAMGIMLVSAVSVQFLYSNLFQGWAVLLKVAVDSALFVLAFILQRRWVFKGKHTGEA